MSVDWKIVGVCVQRPEMDQESDVAGGGGVFKFKREEVVFRFSAGRPVHVSSGEEMDMEVGNRFAAGFSVVDDESETGGSIEFFRHFDGD